MTAQQTDNALRQRLDFIELDEAANAELNAGGARPISTGASRARVYVIPTDEERMIAHHTLEILRRRRR